MTNAEFREHRRALDITQAAMGQMLGYDRVTVARWEKDVPVPIVVGRLLRLMVQRGIKVDDLPPYASDGNTRGASDRQNPQ